MVTKSVFKKVIIKSFSLISIICLFFAFSLTSSAETDETITIGVYPDHCPMFYIDKTNKIVGIGADLLKEIAKEAHLKIQFEIIKESSLKEALDNTKYDLIVPFSNLIINDTDKPAITSNTIMEAPFVFVTLDTKNLKDISKIKIGMLNSLENTSKIIKKLYPNMNIIFYDDIDSCVDALRKNEVDALLHNSYTWCYILQKPSFEDLRMHPTKMFSVSFKAGAADSKGNRILIDKINKGIENISDAKKQAIILDYTTRKLYKFTLQDYIYIYKYSIIVVVLLFILSIIFVENHKKLLKIKTEKYIKHLANKDALTGIVNINGFREKAKKIIKENKNFKYILVYVNLRDFKYINNTFGKKEGDNLLKFTVSKIIENLTENEIVGRIESDHFVVLQKAHGDFIRNGAKSFTEPVRNFFVNKGKEFTVQICAGIYLLTQDDYDSPDIDRMIDLARIAEQKVRNIKKEGFELYNHSYWEKEKYFSEITNHLQFAIENKEILVYYQPQIDYIQNKIIGAEALCRWNHAELGWISPGDFIPALEKSGYISKLDFYVWEKVCMDLSRWNKEGIKRTVSINVSRFDIKGDFDIVEYLQNLISKYDLATNQLNIEITETAFVESKSLIEIIKRLRNIGFKVEIDDFGSGYSSLNMLKDIPVDRIKMDLHFLSGNSLEEKSKVIIECMIFMAKRLGIDLIAEGVETIEQADMLKELGCTDMQGYLFFKPLPVEDFEKLT